MPITAKEIAEYIDGELSGDGCVAISGVNSINDAGPGDIVFLESGKLVDSLKQSGASCVVTSIDPRDCGKTVIRCKNASLSLTKIIDHFFPQENTHPRGIHEKAVIADDADVGKEIAAGAYCVVESGASIGDGTVLYPHVYVGRRCSIGRGCLIYPHVTIREGCGIGDNVIIHSGTVIGSDGFGYVKDGDSYKKIPQRGTVLIENDVEIGAGVTIDRARFGRTVIGRGTKIDNLTQIAHNVKVGENTIIVAQAGVSGSVNIGKNVIIGGQVGIADHVDIGDNSIVASKGGVTKSIPPKTIMSGVPARPHNITKRLVAYIDNLPALNERVYNLEKKLQEPGK